MERTIIWNLKVLEIYFFGNCAYYYISTNYILILVTIMYLFIFYSLCISCCVDQKLIPIYFPQFLCDMICSYEITSLDWADIYTYSKCSHKLFLHGILMFLALNFLWCRLLLFLQYTRSNSRTIWRFESAKYRWWINFGGERIDVHCSS